MAQGLPRPDTQRNFWLFPYRALDSRPGGNSLPRSTTTKSRWPQHKKALPRGSYLHTCSTSSKVQKRSARKSQAPLWTPPPTWTATDEATLDAAFKEAGHLACETTHSTQLQMTKETGAADTASSGHQPR